MLVRPGVPWAGGKPLRRLSERRAHAMTSATFDRFEHLLQPRDAEDRDRCVRTPIASGWAVALEEEVVAAINLTPAADRWIQAKSGPAKAVAPADPPRLLSEVTASLSPDLILVAQPAFYIDSAGRLREE